MEAVSDGLAWFMALPSYLKLMLVAGLATPLLILRSYLNPAPPPPPPPGDIDIVLPDGKRARGYLRGGDVFVKRK